MLHTSFTFMEAVVFPPQVGNLEFLYWGDLCSFSAKFRTCFSRRVSHTVLVNTTQNLPRPDKLCTLSEWKQPEHTSAWERLRQFPSLDKIWAFSSFCKCLRSLSHEVIKRKILTTVIIPLLVRTTAFFFFQQIQCLFKNFGNDGDHVCEKTDYF